MKGGSIVAVVMVLIGGMMLIAGWRNRVPKVLQALK